MGPNVRRLIEDGEMIAGEVLRRLNERRRT
jgi:hypothetical protein